MRDILLFHRSDLPQGWRFASTGEVCHSIVPGRNRPRNWGGDIPWIRTDEIKDKISLTENDIELRVSKEELNQVGGKVAPPKSVVMTCVGDLGIATVLRDAASMNQQLHAFVCGNDILPEYLAFYIMNHKSQIEHLATKTTVAYLNKNSCDSIPILLPPIEEQRIIIEILLGVENNIVLSSQISNRLFNFKRGLIQHLLTRGIGHTRFKKTKIGEIPESWDLQKLSDIAAIMMGQSPPSSTYNEEGDGLPFYQGNMDFGSRFPTTRIYCSSPSRIVEKEDILMTVRAPVGEVNIAGEKCAIGRGVTGIRPKSVEREYLFQYLLTCHNYWNKVEQGSTFKAVNRKEIENLLIPIPSQDEQVEISQTLFLVDKIRDVEKKQNVELNNLKKGLMQVLLMGKVRVRP